MKEDFFTCLTSEIRDEVMERYVTERRVMELQIDEIHERSKVVRRSAAEAAKRLVRLSYWMLTVEMRQRLMRILAIPEASPWREYLEKGNPYDVHSIEVSAFRDRIKLRKIILRSYERMFQRMGRYKDAFENFSAEMEAVKINLNSYRKNFEVSTVLGFLKSLDTCATEKSHFLGGNFTAEELNSVEEKLRFRLPTLEALLIVPPLSLPELHRIEYTLIQLADSIFDHHQNKVKELMQVLGREGY